MGNPEGDIMSLVMDLDSSHHPDEKSIGQSFGASQARPIHSSWQWLEYWGWRSDNIGSVSPVAMNDLLRARLRYGEQPVETPDKPPRHEVTSVSELGPDDAGPLAEREEPPPRRARRAHSRRIDTRLPTFYGGQVDNHN